MRGAGPQRRIGAGANREAGARPDNDDQLGGRPNTALHPTPAGAMMSRRG